MWPFKRKREKSDSVKQKKSSSATEGPEVFVLKGAMTGEEARKATDELLRRIGIAPEENQTSDK